MKCPNCPSATLIMSARQEISIIKEKNHFFQKFLINYG